MADFAQMLYGSAEKAQETQGQGLAQSLHQGASLALQQEQLQQEQQKMQQQKAQLKLASISKVADWMEASSKMPDGPVKQAFTTNHIPKGIEALGLKDVFDPTVSKMFEKDPLIGQFIISKVANGEYDPSILASPDTIAKMYPGAIAMASSQDISRVSASYQKEILEAQKEALDRKSRETAAGIKAESYTGPTKQLSDFGKAVVSPPAGSDMGVAKQMVNAADAIKLLTDAHVPKNATREQRIAAYDKLTPQQNSEVVRSLDKLLSRANPTVHGMETLETNTWADLAAKYGQKVLNTPQGARQGEFIINIMDTVNRERALNSTKYKTAANSLKETQINANKTHGKLMTKIIDDAVKEPSIGGETIKFNGKDVSREALQRYVDDPSHSKNADLPAIKKALGVK